MKITYSLIMLVSSWFGASTIKPKQTDVTTPQVSFYSLKIKSVSGETIDFSKFKGKKVLIVNTASKCGFTPQYKELQELHEKYGNKVAILGFPCNDFNAQEPGSEKDIQKFCQINYGVSFPMSEKVHVRGEKKHPIYKWLTEKDQNGWNTQEPTWNFCKYLINEKGELVRFYKSSVSPMSKEIINEL